MNAAGSSKMHYARRLLGWAIFLGCVTALGGCVFFFVRHRPRCTIVGSLDTIHLSSDGSRLVTRRTMPNHDKHIPKEPGWTLHYGPLQVWDTHSGQVLHEWLHDATMRWTVMSPDGRHIAIVTGDGRIGGGELWLVDDHTGQDWRFEEPQDVNRLEFSPKGRWLVVNTARGDPQFLIDVATHQVALRLKDSWPSISSDDRLLYVRKGPDCNLTMWDLEAGKALGVLATTSPHYQISADGRLLLERHIEPS
jgi:dipeptidyl aminopeptidase/acylaminoacyl peptidase